MSSAGWLPVQDKRRAFWWSRFVSNITNKLETKVCQAAAAASIHQKSDSSIPQDFSKDKSLLLKDIESSASA